MTEPNLERCLYLIGLQRRIAQGESPESPFPKCYDCIDHPELQTAILCPYYQNITHIEYFRSIFHGK